MKNGISEILLSRFGLEELISHLSCFSIDLVDCVFKEKFLFEAHPP